MGQVPSTYASGAGIAALLVLLAEFAMLRAPSLRSQFRLYMSQSLVVVVLAAVTAAVRGLDDLYVLAGLSLLLKVVLVPALLVHLLREAGSDLSGSPALKVASMVLVAIAASAFGFFTVGPLGFRSPVLPSSAFAVAAAVVMVAFVLIILRSDVVSQAVGFFSVENGVSLASMVVAAGLPIVVELTLLFDLLVAVVAFGLIMRAHHALRGTLYTWELDRLRG